MKQYAARLAAIWMLGSQAAWAQATPTSVTVTKQAPAAAGEILAQVAARGIVRTKPDLATFRVTVSGQGSTTAAARAAVDATTRQLATKLIDSGLDRTSVRVLPGNGARLGFITNEAFPADQDADVPEGGAALTAAMARHRKAATNMIEVQVSDMARLGAVRTVLEQQDGATALQPTLSLRDDSSARRNAIADAIAKAKQDADAYAAALGMRVDRIVRVYDQAAAVSQTQDFASMISLMDGGGDDQVVTEVRLGLEVVLAAR